MPARQQAVLLIAQALHKAEALLQAADVRDIQSVRQTVAALAALGESLEESVTRLAMERVQLMREVEALASLVQELNDLAQRRRAAAPSRRDAEQAADERGRPASASGEEPRALLAQAMDQLRQRAERLLSQVMHPVPSGLLGRVAAGVALGAALSAPAPALAMTVVVQPGDTLSAIAQRYYGSTAYVRDIAQANGISNPDFIVAGMTLTLPERPPASAAAVAPVAGTVVVQAGDTLTKISQRYYGSPNYVQAIADANGITNPHYIKAGATLKLPSLDQGSGQPARAPVRESPTVAGIATYYGIEDGYVGGTMYCGAPFNPADPTIVAVKPGRYPCGTRLLVTEPRSGRSIQVVVTDYCGGCSDNHLDLSRAAFGRLGPIKQGRLDVVWTRLP